MAGATAVDQDRVQLINQRTLFQIFFRLLFIGCDQLEHLLKLLLLQPLHLFELLLQLLLHGYLAGLAKRGCEHWGGQIKRRRYWNV